MTPHALAPRPVPVFRPEAIPFELRMVPNWVPWGYKWNSGKAKWDKPPRRIDGTAGSSTAPDARYPFAIALAAVERNEDFDGVGFVLTRDTPFAAIDLDHCVDPSTGELEPWAGEIVEALDSYTEVSPSGNGLRIMVRAQLPEGRRRRKHLEMYDDCRYVTITGNVIADKPVEDRQAQVDALHASTFPPALAPAPYVVATPSLDDRELIERASNARNGAEFAALYRGDNPGDHSASDLKLCGMLAFWTGRDGLRMDRLFRASGLMRPKWDERRGDATYGAMTIAKALGACQSAYDPAAAIVLPHGSKRPRVGRTSAVPENREIANEPLTDAPGWIAHDTELGVAQYFAALHGDNIRYVHASGLFYCWDGKKWAPDTDGAVNRIVHEYTRALTCLALDAADSEKSAKRLRFALPFETYRKQQAIVALARDMSPIAAKVDAFDRDPYLLNVQNGTIDLRTGMLREHQRDDMLSRISPVGYDPSAKCDLWMAFLAEVFDQDEDLVKYVQRAVGYSLTGLCVEHVLFIAHGSGSNGKSTFVSAIGELLGDYATTTEPGTFVARRDNAATNDVARLHNVRFVSSVEGGANQCLSEAFVKGVTGGDAITARFLYKEYFAFVPIFKLWFATNHLPKIRDTDDGIWRRIMLIPFKVRFVEEKRDRQLLRKLQSEFPGILAWAVRGAMDYVRNGLGRAGAVASATADYRSDMDTLGLFLAQGCVVEPAASVLTVDLLSAYNKWRETQGERTVTSNALTRLLKERHFEASRNSKGRGFLGLRLAQTMTPDDTCDTSDPRFTKVAYARAYSDFGENGLKPSQVSSARLGSLACRSEDGDLGGLDL